MAVHFRGSPACSPIVLTGCRGRQAKETRWLSVSETLGVEIENCGSVWDVDRPSRVYDSLGDVVLGRHSIVVQGRQIYGVELLYSQRRARRSLVGVLALVHSSGGSIRDYTCHSHMLTPSTLIGSFTQAADLHPPTLLASSFAAGDSRGSWSSSPRTASIVGFADSWHDRGLSKSIGRSLCNKACQVRCAVKAGPAGRIRDGPRTGEPSSPREVTRLPCCTGVRT